MALVAATLLSAGAVGCGDDGDSTTAGDGTVSQAAPKPEADSQGSGATGKSGTGKSATGDSGAGKSGDKSASDAGGSGSGSGDAGGSGGSSGAGSNGSSPAPEPNKEFLTPGGDNSVQTFGEEADDGERAAASAVLEAFMDGRASLDWATVCKHMTKDTVEPLEKLLAPGKGCVTTLTAGGKRLEPNVLANTMTGPIDSFRVEGNRGFALWHGNDGVDYVMPMSRDGEWKVTLFEPTPLS